jgi:hypothetical protein
LRKRKGEGKKRSEKRGEKKRKKREEKEREKKEDVNLMTTNYFGTKKVGVGDIISGYNT